MSLDEMEWLAFTISETKIIVWIWNKWIETNILKEEPNFHKKILPGEKK